MDRFPSHPENSAFDWAHADVFLHTLLELLENVEYPALEGLEPNLFVLHSESKTFVVLRYDASFAPKLAELVKSLVSHPTQGALEIALLGGGEAARQLLEQTPPKRGSLTMLHMPFAETGAPGPVTRILGHGRSTLARALTTARQRAGRPIEAATARSKLAAAEKGFVQLRNEQQEFSRRLSTRKPQVTYAILALIGLSFVLQIGAGATSSTEALIERGALYGPAVLEGEWWRLASCTLLHGGFMHVAFNSYVLFALGSLVERLLGGARFVLLYVLTGTAASLGSLLLIGGVSVGASGAIWGLLGAEAALAFGPNKLLPPSIKRSLKRATIVNLAINTMASFLPHVDWAAHFSGGALGAALVASGVLMPHTERPATARDPLRVVATLLACVFFGAALYGVLVGAQNVSL